ncbi:MAG TPA: glycosyltransferase family 4 protein, partial [Patescibacteria group bacterium]|nr:glycosyltransferase family 4 protein [Patescibacteria group bacterium]
PSYLDELKKLAKGDSRIMFLGRVSGEPVNQLFTHAYLFVQPSESEGLPIVVLEAMSNGTAVLVSDIPGNLEAIHRAGFTFENMNVDDLTVQLKNLLKHPELVEHARHDVKKIIIKNFNWDTIADKTLDVYRSVRH